MRVFVNRGMRRIFEFKRDGETSEWGKLHSEQLNDIYFSFIIRVIK